MQKMSKFFKNRLTSTDKNDKIVAVEGEISRKGLTNRMKYGIIRTGNRQQATACSLIFFCNNYIKVVVSA
jgi:hypothetical protein